jgi:multidrug efflux pump subunit AcrA (membrane-fusion protein)
MRPYITKIIAVIIVVGAVYGAGLISDSKKKRKAISSTNVPAAYVMSAKNETIPVSIIENGRISAKYKIDVYAEVQGLMEMGQKEFKPGASYKKGETLVRIKSDEFYANLQAQKSVLQNLITAMMPDLKLDFPKAFNKWDAYLTSFDINKSIAPLPEPMSDKEKFFVSGRDIYTTYYNTKNLEIIYAKYQLKAPFDGILTEALVTPGSLIRNGQKLGEFINPNEYELEIAISKDFVGALRVGTDVLVANPENESQQWNGKVSRINGKIDPSTQTVQLFVSIKGDDLKEGMYLEASITGEGRIDAIEVKRNLLIDNTNLYTVNEDSVLVLSTINVVHKSRSTVVVQGVEENSWVLLKAIPGAYPGMKVSVKPQD